MTLPGVGSAELNSVDSHLALLGNYLFRNRGISVPMNGIDFLPRKIKEKSAFPLKAYHLCHIDHRHSVQTDFFHLTSGGKKKCCVRVRVILW